MLDNNNDTSVDDLVDGVAKVTMEEIQSKPTKVFQARKKEIKDRLFIGEGDFSFAKSFANLRKQNTNAGEVLKHITATEYLAEDTLKNAYEKNFLDNINELKELGVTIKTGVDGTQLGSYGFFKSRRFQSIHFNFPHDKSEFTARTLPILLEKFFASASQLQKPGDRIHMALPRPKETGKRQFYEAYVYRIFNASSTMGYNLIETRLFDDNRFPGYKHVVTGQNRTADVSKEAAEYIFEFTGLSKKFITDLRNPSSKKAYNETSFTLPINTIVEAIEEKADDVYEDLPVLKHWGRG